MRVTAGKRASRAVLAVVTAAAIGGGGGFMAGSVTAGQDAPRAAAVTGPARGSAAPAREGGPAQGGASGAAGYAEAVRRVLPSVALIRTPSGLGSGIVIDKAGNIVTNAHVGSPLGLSGSVTEGIVSATGRTVTGPAGAGSPGATLPGAIQISAPINPGNSGGALVNTAGEVVGIPALAAGQQDGAQAQGIGFAIPASKAGLRPGDVIRTAGHQPTPDTTALAQALAAARPGQPVTLTITRDAATLTAHIILGELPG